jgi:hypothetical protein
MGYDVHITRAESWLDAEENPITLPEWLKYVEGDPEMRLDKVAVARDRKGKPVLAYQNEGLAVWVAYSRHEPTGNMAWFDWHGGCIVVKNPDDEIIAKMKRIAAALGAFVVGDDGEHY